MIMRFALIACCLLLSGPWPASAANGGAGLAPIKADRKQQAAEQQDARSGPAARTNVISSAPPPGNEEPFWPKVAASSDGQTIYLVGELAVGSFEKFRRVLDSNPQARTVYLSSPGGYVWDGFLIGATLRARGMNSYVEHYCASACTQIFVAGAQRVLGPDAVLGFHQSYTDEEVANDTLFGEYAAIARQDEASGGLMEQSYRRAGVSDEFIASVGQTPYDDMWFPSAQELASAGVITRQAGTAEIAADAGLFLSRRDVDQSMPANRFWSALSKQEPALFDAAAGSAWRMANAGMSVAGAWQEARAIAADNLNGRLAYAPDPLLGRFTDHMAHMAMFERNRNYAACEGGAIDPETGFDAQFAANEKESDDIYADLLENGQWLASGSLGSARKEFMTVVAQMFEDAAQEENSALFGSKCVSSLKMMELLTAMEEPRRTKVMRGLLQLGAEGMAPDAAVADYVPLVGVRDDAAD